MSDNTDQGSATAHLFAPIQAPRIKSISPKAVQDFLADREAYEDAIQAQPGLAAVSYRSCFAALFLKSLVRARVFGAGTTEVAHLSDDVIRTKLQEIAGSTRTVSVEAALADVKRNVRLDSNEPDARLRIIMLSASYLELCEKRGWNVVENSQKAAIKHIISVLQPVKLRTRVEDALKLEQAHLKGNYFGFMDFLADKAEIFEEVQPLREYLQSRNKRREGGKAAPKATPSESKGKPTIEKLHGKPKDNKGKKSLPACLNPECPEFHLVKNCKITSEELAKKLLEEFRAKQKANKKPSVSALVRTKPSKEIETPVMMKSIDNTAVVKADLNGYTFACRIDSGADRDAISETIITFLGDKGEFLPTKLVSQPEQLQAIDGHTLHSRGSAQISPLIQTMAGPCRLRNINVQILSDVDTHVRPGNACAGEIILGNPFLRASGLNVKDFNTDNIDRLAAIDYSDLTIQPATATVGKLGRKLLSSDIDMNELPPNNICSMISNDNFPLRDGDDIDYKDVKVGVEDKKEAEDAIEAMISRGMKHLPKSSRYVLTELVTTYRDAFRVKLGRDPPVDVEPIHIEFEGETRPLKVRQRTYSPEQLKFLTKKVQELSEAGFINRNNSSKWACAPLIVPKPGKEGFRFTVDLRPINSQTKTNVWPMPHADPMLAKLTRSQIWFNLDF